MRWWYNTLTKDHLQSVRNPGQGRRTPYAKIGWVLYDQWLLDNPSPLDKFNDKELFEGYRT